MKKLFFQTALILLTLTVLLGSVSCGGRGETLLTLKKDGIEVTYTLNEYQFVMSTVKATLSDVDWDKWVQSDPPKTMDEYYRDNILENCKTTLISLYLFEKEGLTLSDAEMEKIDEIMNEYLQTDGDGSKSKLNAILADYGVNYDILRDIHIIEAKVDKIKTHLCGENASNIDASIKDAYMKNNYVHFNQVYLPFTKFVYELDKNNQPIYFKRDANGTVGTSIFYDTENGVASEETDKNGDTVYYVKDSIEIAYNKIDGVRKKLTEDNGSYQTVGLTDAEKNALRIQKDELLAQLQGADAEKFEATIASVRKELDLDPDENTDGIYVRRINYSASSNTAYLSDIITACDGMSVGDVTVVESSYGYHIIRKYDFTPNAYELEANVKGWFSTFSELVTDDFFTGICKPYYADVKVDTEVYAKAPKMKDVKANKFF